MDQTVSEEYKSSLNDLNFNSKPLINMLTMLADENKKHAATIVKTIVDHINSAPLEAKLPGLYLVDSIMKNLGDEYMKIFCQKIISLFTSVFGKVDENTRSLMFKLRQTWTDILPNKILYNLDVSVKELDPAWPITAKHPSKSILINPKFLDGSVQEKKASDVPTDSSTSLKKEEDQIKQKQGEVLKQLLAKQEQLRQLEMKKLQMSMKKKNVPIGSNVGSSNSLKKNTRDPRLVKTSVSQNVPPAKPCSNHFAQEKPATSKSEPGSTSTNIPCTKNVTFTSKAHVQTGSSFPISNVNIDEQSHKPPDHETIQQKKVTPKNKNHKNAVNKNKQVPFPSHKVDQESGGNLSENIANATKICDSSIKTDISPKKIYEKNLKDNSKLSKISPKKKNIVSDKNKVPQISANVPGDIVKKKISQMRIPKKTEKQKLPLQPDTLSSECNKTVSENVKEHITSSSDIENVQIQNKSMKLDDIVNKPKPVRTNDSQGNISDLKMIAHKDEDLRVSAVPENEDDTNLRVPKRDIQECNTFSTEMDKLHPPRKKIKSSDTENCSPDHGSDSPVLFGSEDQDLRHPSFSDISSKDWSQYKANHPDEYSPSPGKHENVDSRYRSRRFQFSHKYHHPSDYDRYGPPRSSRGRYTGAMSRHFYRKNFPRGMRGRWSHSPIPSLMLDSHAILQEAEKKFRLGRISKTEYIDLRRDLQKMAESSEYQFFRNYVPKKQDVEYHIRIPDNLKSREEQEHETKLIADNIRIQRPSANPPSEKVLVLDGKERIIRFIDDKAIALMDNNEPHEVSFKDEQKKVYVEGMAEPLTLGFDGKSIEFELDGHRHVMRFGTPGRELYINNCPYEAQFGGPPLVAMLDDGRVYKMHLSGPAPQVVIGNKPEYDLSNKCHDLVNVPFKKEIKDENKEQTSCTEYDIPSSSTSLQDVDMRMKIDSTAPHEILMNEDSPFYSKDMKDVDWRQIPPSVKPEKNLPNMYNGKATKSDPSYETWVNDDTDNKSSLQDRNNQIEKSVPKESLSYEWDMPGEQQKPPLHLQQSMHHPPEHMQQQMLHPPEHMQQQMHHPPEHMQQQRLPQENMQQQRLPPEHIQQQRLHPLENIEEQRLHPPEHMQQQRQHQQDRLHFPEHMQQHPPEHMEQQRHPPPEHIQHHKQHPPEHMQEHRHHPQEHMHQHRQHPSEHLQQYPSAHMQMQNSLHLEDVFPQSDSQKRKYKQDNIQLQNDDYRKNYHSSHPQEQNMYPSARTSVNQHFEDGNKHYDHHPYPSFAPYAQRPSFRGRPFRGRYPGPNFRPPVFNADYNRPRRNSPLLELPKTRFSGTPQRPPLLPPPVLPLFQPTPAMPEGDVSAIASDEIKSNLSVDGPSSEIQTAESKTSEVKVDIESLLEKLVAAGIINTNLTKMYEESEPPLSEIATVETENDKADEETEESPEENEKIELTAESLRIHRPSVISALHKGMQCATCGMRFKELQTEQYSRHLDWHFRMNRRERDGAKKAISRNWYFEIEDWIQFEEFEDFEERTPSYFELQADDTQPEEPEVPAVISVPATSDDQDNCPVCLERFQLFWVEDEEEWHYRNAVRHDNIAYHPACYEDFKKASEAEKALKDLEYSSSDLAEIDEEIIDILNSVLDHVCKVREVIKEICSETDLPVAMETTEVPPSEIHSEEILEGKPGEEEIIGLISESDAEMDSDAPKAESKMVVMQSGGITLKVKAESLQCHSPSTPSEKDTKVEDDKILDDEEIEFRPPTPDPNFEVRPPVSRGHELSGLCCIM